MSVSSMDDRIRDLRPDCRQRLAAVARELRGSHPWIPGTEFVAIPGLAEYLARCVEDFAALTAVSEAGS